MEPVSLKASPDLIYPKGRNVIPHVGSVVTSNIVVIYTSSKTWLIVIVYLPTLLQKIFPTLEEHVHSIVVGKEMQVRLGWLQQPMFDLS